MWPIFKDRVFFFYTLGPGSSGKIYSCYTKKNGHNYPENGLWLVVLLFFSKKIFQISLMDKAYCLKKVFFFYWRMWDEDRGSWNQAKVYLSMQKWRTRKKRLHLHIILCARRYTKITKTLYIFLVYLFLLICNCKQLTAYFPPKKIFKIKDVLTLKKSNIT